MNRYKFTNSLTPDKVFYFNNLMDFIIVANIKSGSYKKICKDIREKGFHQVGEFVKIEKTTYVEYKNSILSTFDLKNVKNNHPIPVKVVQGIGVII